MQFMTYKMSYIAERNSIDTLGMAGFKMLAQNLLYYKTLGIF